MLNLNRVDNYFVDSLDISFERINKGGRLVTVCKIVSHNNNYILSNYGEGVIGISVLNPEDVDDPVVGANEAFENALSEVKSNHVKSLVKNFYKAGEVIFGCYQPNKNRRSGYLYMRGMF